MATTGSASRGKEAKTRPPQCYSTHLYENVLSTLRQGTAAAHGFDADAVVLIFDRALGSRVSGKRACELVAERKAQCFARWSTAILTLRTVAFLARMSMPSV